MKRYCAFLLLAACPSSHSESDGARLPAPAAADAQMAMLPPMPAEFPIHEATKKEAEDALSRLQGWVKPGASDPANGWALAHGIIAYGKDLETTDKRKAIDVMVGDFAEKAKMGKREVIRFPELSEAHIPVAPHRDLIVKSLLEAGVPLEKRFKPKKNGEVTLDRLVKDAAYQFSFPTTDEGWQNFAWSASAFFIGAAKEKKIHTEHGDVTFEDLATRTMDQLEKEQSFLEPLMASNRPDRVQKRKQGIYAHTCGGLHFVQAAVLGAAVTGREDLLLKARHELDLVLFRWEAERRIYKQALFQQPDYKWILLVQQLKFYGHVVETFALAEDWGVLHADAEMKQKLRRIMGDLTDTILALEEAYVKQDDIRANTVQQYYDLIGDGCHAIRGLTRSLVAFFPA